MRQAPVDRIEGVVEAADGTPLRSMAWMPPGGAPVRARLVLVHGLGEHAARYDELGRHLAARGTAVFAWDQRGHGRSPGRRGAVAALDRLIDDLEVVMERARETLPGEGEPFLFGHSMGGLVVIRYIQTRRGPLAGAILSAPWLGTAVDVPAWKRMAAVVLRAVAPRVTLPLGLDADVLTRDPEKRREYEEDPLVHDRMAAGLYHTALVAQGRALAGTPPPDLPLLFLIPLDDRLTDAGLARAWAEGLEGPVTVHLLDGFRHEPLNDTGRASVYARVTSWIEERAGGEPVPGDRVLSSPRSRAGRSGGRDDPQNPEERDQMNEKPASDQETAVEDADREQPAAGPEPAEDETGGDDAPVADDPTPADLSDELDHLQEEFDALNDRHLRLAAEFNNYRRRQEAQMTDAWARAQADLVGRFLEVLDDLQRVSALDPADEAVTVESIVEGIDLVERKFVRMLEEAGAEVLEPEEGDPFDPERMEAMMRVADETGERDDQVAAVFQKGYAFKGSLVRPARVSVYKEQA